MKNGIRWMICALAALVLGGVLGGCEKSEKKSLAGGGVSTQSLMTVKGAGR